MLMRLNFISKLSYNSLHRPLPHKPVVRQNDVPQKVDPVSVFPNLDFLRMQLEGKLLTQEFLYRLDQAFQILLAFRNDYEIVRVARVVSLFQFLFHKLIKLVHVDVRKKLRGEVADRNAASSEEIRLVASEALDDFFHEPHGVGILNLSAKKREKYSVVHRVEEFSYVAFQRIARLGIVLGNLSKHLLHSKNPFMRSLADTAGKRGRDKSGFKRAVQNLKNGVVKHAVTNGRLVDVPQLRVVDVEAGVRTVPICLAYEVPVQRKDFLLEVLLEVQNIRLTPFAALELVPRQKEVLWTRDLIK